MMKKFKHLITTLCLFLCFISTISAFAYDSRNLDYANWIKNDQTVVQNVNVKGAMANLNGSLAYYYDNANTIYFWLSASEKSLSYAESVVTLDFTFDRPSSSISFSVDENGIVDANTYLNKYFSVDTNYVTYNTTKSGDYVVAIDVLNNKEINDISLYATINGHRYKLIENETISFEKKVYTTAKTTKKNNKQTTAKATKFYIKGGPTTTKNKSKKYNSSDNTTKYNVTLNNYDEITTAVAGGETVINQLPEVKASLTPKAKYTVITCSITGGIGVLLIIIGSILSNIKKKKEEIIPEENADNFDF